MIPHGTPVATISASWQARASSSIGSEKPAASQSARPTATSRAALDESPPPSGIVEVTVASMPDRITAPLRKRAHDPGGVAPPRLDRPSRGRCFRPRRLDLAGPIERAEDDPSVVARLSPDEAVEVDRQREDEPLVVVGVVADQVDAPGSAIRTLRHDGALGGLQAHPETIRSSAPEVRSSA